jgi:hypothetical protein
MMPYYAEHVAEKFANDDVYDNKIHGNIIARLL